MTEQRRACACGATITARYARYCPACRWRTRRKPPKYPWDAERDALLRREYDPRVRKRAQAIAAQLGYPAWAVKRRAAYLGLTRKLDRRDWTSKEERFLLDHAGSRHVNWMARKLGRTVTSVVVKLKRMKLSRRFREGYTLRELELCFGVDHKVIEGWASRGLLKVGHRGTSHPRDAWLVTDEQILQFIASHPLEFRLDKCDQFWFMDLLLGGGLVKRALEAAREVA